MNIMKKVLYEDGKPCNHIGCLNHATHPCENCGRILGKGTVVVEYEDFIQPQKLVVPKDSLIILTTDGKLSQKAYFNIKSSFEKILEEYNSKVVILEDGLRVDAILTKEEDKTVECNHKGWDEQHNYDIKLNYYTCPGCNMIKTGSQWGIASNMWFKDINHAVFYQNNGRLPE